MKFRSLTNASGSEIQKVRQEEKNAILVQHRPWKLVNNRDGLAYGQLHFGTQKDIRQVNEVEDNELFLKYDDDSEGRADIWKKNNPENDDDYTYIYLWEVKPHSYLETPNKTKGETHIGG